MIPVRFYKKNCILFYIVIFDSYMYVSEVKISHACDTTVQTRYNLILRNKNSRFFDLM